MWMLTDLKRQNEVAMTELGLQISAEAIYNPDGIALKDAVVHFGGGCTGEVISAEGLVLTNHHCGYGAIQQHSSVEHDYLTDGFWAMSRSEELPCKGLTVTYIDEIMDVTDYVGEQLRIDSDPNGTNYLSPKYLAMVADRFLSEQGITLDAGRKAELKAFYGGNKYYLFLKTTYSDIRMVGAPPPLSASSAPTPTIGCGRGTRAISPCSASMPAKTGSRRPTAPTTCPCR